MGCCPHSPCLSRLIRPAAPKEKRSEEHTSELQSPCNLVCRLLLEKNKEHRHYHRQRSHHHTIRLTLSLLEYGYLSAKHLASQQGPPAYHQNRVYCVCESHHRTTCY